MPRTARVISETGMYHIIIRSLSEVDLFKEDEDKIMYLELMKKYQFKYGFGIYSYCLMSNHGHILIDTLGSDISKVMHVVNFSYAMYYNRKYKRRGPVFQDRFVGIPVLDQRYFITLTAYIHNNPKDIPCYKDRVATYPFSSLKEYINGTDTYDVLDTSVLKGLIGLNNGKDKERYLELVGICDCSEVDYNVEIACTETEYRSEKAIISRHMEPTRIMAYVADYLDQDPLGIHMKYNKSFTKLRAISCFLMSAFCDIKQKDICELIGNITQARVSKLSIMGMEFALKDERLLEECLLL